MAKTKAKKAAKKKKGKDVVPEIAEMQKREAARKRLLDTVMDARSKKDKHTTEAALLAAKRKDEMESANKWEKIEQEAIEDILKLDGGQFIDRLPFGDSTTQPQSVAGQVAASTPAQASSDKPTQAEREKELEGVKIADFAKGAILQKLESAGIANGLQLFKWLNDSFPKDIKGIGTNAKDKLGDALTEWWMKHPYEVAGKTTTAAPKNTPVDPDAPLTSTKPEPIADKVRDSDAIEVINMQGKLILEVAQRQNEHYCYGYLVKLDDKHSHEQSWFGHYPPESKDQCYRDALAAVSAKIGEWKQGTLPLPALKVADEIGLQLIETGKLIAKKAKKAASAEGAVAAGA